MSYVLINKRSIILYFLMVSSILLIGRLTINPGMIRNLLFLSLFLVMLGLALYYRERIIGLMIVYLAFMGFFRRALIPIAGWSGFDPLLIIGPGLTVILALLLLWERKNNPSIMKESPDKLMNILFVFGCFQVLNPLSGGPVAGLIASMYILVPWLWFYLAFYKFNRSSIKSMMNIIQVIGTVIAVYGIYQTFFGILPFEMAWVNISGYAALYLAEDTVRAFGTFASAQEFVYFIMLTCMIAFARIFTDENKFMHISISVLTFSAVFFGGSRTIIFFMFAAMLVILMLVSRNIIGRIIITSFSILAMSLLWFILPRINPAWFGVAEPIIEHVVAGLTDPLSEELTGIGHLERFADGMMSIFSNPIGYGIASITKAADKLSGSTAMSTEVDISNMIVALGVGGIIYSLVIFFTIYKTITLVNITKRMEYLAVLAVFVGSLGQWINGGFYLVPIIIWAFAGWIHKEYKEVRGDKRAFSSS
ncbi:hypothetical protein ACERII_12845 [Evansella sp. AB-rgal1]|uniref:hypothetical protein n=1 Tax=Evansella sp. AB-rgal1 TaxID=3242696 RepID=UPI00359D7BF4